MMKALEIIASAWAVLSAVGLAIFLAEMRNAPFGYEDENGFHVTRERLPMPPRRRPESPEHLPHPGAPA